MTRARELAELATSYDSGSSLGFRNRIINGDMRIDQRNVGAAVTSGSGSTAGAYAPYPVDRFVAQSFSTAAGNGAAFTAQRNAGGITPPPGFSNYVGITVTSTQATLQSGSVYRFIHRIEGFNISDLGWGSANASAVTLSFWVRSSVAGTYGGVLNNTGNGGWRVYPFTFAISAANTWEYKTVVIPGDVAGSWRTNQDAGIEVSITFGISSNWAHTPGVWGSAEGYGAAGTVNLMATNGATFQLTGMQLESGTVATPFERRDYGRELMMCQRYYEKSFPHGVTPANGGSSTTLATVDGSVSGMAQNRIGAGPTTQFKVSKRAIPTMTKYGNSSGDWIYALQNSNALVGNANSGLGRVSESAFTADQQIVDGTAIFVIGHWTASAEL